MASGIYEATELFVFGYGVFLLIYHFVFERTGTNRVAKKVKT
jgi:hypothetical protein